MDTAPQMRVDLELGTITTSDGRRQIAISEAQRMALEWLMGGGSITEAAQYAGVVRQTVSRWLSDDADFRELFAHWQSQVRALNQARLISLSEAALETVSEAIRQKRDAKVALVILKGMGMLNPAK